MHESSDSRNLDCCWSPHLFPYCVYAIDKGSGDAVSDCLCNKCPIPISHQVGSNQKRS